MVGPETAAFPLWNRSPIGFPGMLRADSFSLTNGLVNRLIEWNDFFETHDRPQTNGTATEAEWATWEASGRELTAELQAELGNSVRVYFYLDDLTGIPDYDPTWIPKFASGDFSVVPSAED
jgi:hypothetical protein